MAKTSSLDDYQKKRDFNKTNEPSGNNTRSKNKSIFVIQKHDASSLHYDFRLEVDGVLKSWAVPKGPSTDPKVKRLAIPTEDHPLGYAEFEGVIPEDNYGAGSVIIWDKGTYESFSKKGEDKLTMEEALKKGHITVWLKGKKLKGGYALIRTNLGENERWLFMKMKDEFADARRNPVSTEKESVVSNKTIEDFNDEK